MTIRQRYWAGLGLALVLAAWSGHFSTGCGSETDANVLGGGGTGNAQVGGGGNGTAGSGGDIFIEHGNVVSLTVDPATATIDVQNGAPGSTTFTAIATFEDHFVGPVPASWAFDRPDVALIDLNSGVLTAHGTLGGQGTVTATVQSISATAVGRVVLHIEDNSAGLSPGDIGLFDNPDPQGSGTLLYPYDGTVFGRDILAPEIMWAGGANGDVYYVHLSESFFDAKFYAAVAPPSRFLMSEDQWTELSKSNGGEPVQVDIQRLAGGTAYSAMHESWTIAQGSLRGTIYYWAVNYGRSMKLAPGDSAAVPVWDSGPNTDLGTPAPANYDGTVPPWSLGSNGQRCVSCHTISKNGERLAGVFERKDSAPSPWGTVDLTANPPVLLQIQPYDTNTLFIALTHDGDLAVNNDVNFTFHLRNTDTGALIPSEVDAYSAVADPSFSGDNTMLAFSSNVTGNYPVEFWRADLDVADFDIAPHTFSNRRQIVAAGSEAIAFPSFSPDSKWIFYQRGDYSRAKYGVNSVGHNDLHMADVAKAVGQIPLDAANGVGVLDAPNSHLNYQPNANPIAVGGYYWIVFFSARDYGNRMVSSGNPTYDNRKQLWVAAVNVDPQGGQDPSHPAFWLRGQDLTTINMKGYWVLDPCKQEGNSCDAGFECCTGFCQPDGGGNYVCSPPGSCAQIGEACGGDGDCCDYPDALCIGGFCGMPPPA